MEDLVSYLVQYTGVVYLCGGMCCSVGQLITDALSLVSGVARCVCVSTPRDQSLGCGASPRSSSLSNHHIDHMITLPASSLSNYVSIGWARALVVLVMYTVFKVRLGNNSETLVISI